jgi:hypothetical protein
LFLFEKCLYLIFNKFRCWQILFTCTYVDFWLFS